MFGASIFRESMILVLGASLLLGACGGELAEQEEEELGERQMNATFSAASRLYSIPTKKCAFNEYSWVSLSPCTTKWRHKVTTVTDTNKCTAYTYYYGRPICTGFAFQIKMGSKCIRPVYPYHGVKVALGSCSDDKAWWGSYDKRIFNYASLGWSRRIFLSHSGGTTVITKRPKNAYDQGDTKYKFIN